MEDKEIKEEITESMEILLNFLMHWAKKYNFQVKTEGNDDTLVDKIIIDLKNEKILL